MLALKFRTLLLLQSNWRKKKFANMCVSAKVNEVFTLCTCTHESRFVERIKHIEMNTDRGRELDTVWCLCWKFSAANWNADITHHHSPYRYNRILYLRFFFSLFLWDDIIRMCAIACVLGLCCLAHRTFCVVYDVGRYIWRVLTRASKFMCERVTAAILIQFFIWHTNIL